MARREDCNSFSYSGLKTAFYRLTEEEKIKSKSNSLEKQQIYDLAASFQNRAFQHLERVVTKIIRAGEFKSIKNLLVGGGVAANVELRKRLRKMGKELNLKIRFPYSTKLMGDNAAMIGIAAGLRINVNCEELNLKYDEVDRNAKWSVENKYFLSKT
jgi:N6-L-threonylcarbamoyladenine synthase